MSDRIRSVGRGKDSLNAVNTTVGVVGLGYVGLRLAHAFDEEGYTVHGFDVNERKVRTLREGDDPTRELDAETLARSSVSYTADPAQLEACEFILLAVPTPVDTSNRPNLDAVEAAGRTVGEHMATGTTVVLESTVYPGATRDTLMPVLESASGMPAGEEFFVGYSPERITPGEDGREFRDIVKVVSGQDDRTAQRLRQLYQRLIDVEVHVAPTIEAAEAAKCLENVQRDLNIGLLNEFAIACSETRLDIDSQAVLAAAETKWNFHRYRPGLVGGHCLPVDPYFIIDQFERNGYVLELPRVARHVNERVPRHLVARLADALERRRQRGVSRNTEDCVLVAGLSYKPESADVRSAAIDDVLTELQRRGINVVGYEPHAEDDLLAEAFDIPLQSSFSASGFDALLIPTPHRELRELKIERLAGAMNEEPVFVDASRAFDEQRLTDHGFTYVSI